MLAKSVSAIYEDVKIKFPKYIKIGHNNSESNCNKSFALIQQVINVIIVKFD